MSKFFKKLFGKKDKSQSGSVAGSKSQPASTSTSRPASKAAAAPTSAAAAGTAAGAGAGAGGAAAANESSQAKSGSNPAKIAIIGHSLWGHIDTLVQATAEGVKSTGATVDIFSFGETLPAEVLEKMYAKSKQPYPSITPDALKEYDGYLLAAGTRFGRLPAQVDTFFDQTGGLWATGGLLGKFAGLITSSAGQHGGQETTFVTTLPWLVHHGINYVPIGYQFEQLSEADVVQGGAPWGATTLSKSDGSRQVNSDEKLVAQKQGAYFANIVGTYKKGSSA